ncbi:hypothetical protein [Chryseobacterium sp.]|uniref:hypothetical protein n=1 Tax=Chryseobacterium sp. TaxID=1871047 RepID=UPI0026069FEA|nr:hypothetical protein [Chryseobacterium sp.]
MKKLIVSVVLGLTTTISCSINKKDLLGTYSFTGKNIIDSLIIKEDIYIHKIYNKNSELMYQAKDNWSFAKDRINLEEFYNNEDNELQEPLSNTDAKKFLMLASYPIYRQNDQIIIEVHADENIVYKKNK